MSQQTADAYARLIQRERDENDNPSLGPFMVHQATKRYEKASYDNTRARILNRRDRDRGIDRPKRRLLTMFEAGLAQDKRRIYDINK